MEINRHLSTFSADFLYHIGYNREEAKERFGDVKYVITGGSSGRMRKFADLIGKTIGKDVEDLTRGDRFVFFKIGPVISINHGMGVPSITILLHEIIKLLHYAGAVDPVIIRLGTCGGIGVEAGTVVVTNRALNAFLKEEHQIVIFGEIHPRPTTMNIKLAEEIKASQDITRYNTVLGATMCTDDFYEGQGRIDGAACDFDSIKQREYLEKLKANGVVNIEMEATAIASLCLKTGVRCAIVCVALLDRLKGDQVDIPPADYQDYQERPQNLVAAFIKKDLSKTQP